jgi:hypothetical protein
VSRFGRGVLYRRGLTGAVRTIGGSHVLGDESTSPTSMYVEALDLLLEVCAHPMLCSVNLCSYGPQKFFNKGFDLSRIQAISGAAQVGGPAFPWGPQRH